MEFRKLSFSRLILIAVFFPFLSHSQDDNGRWYPYQKENRKWCFVSVNNGTILNNREFDSVVPFNSGLAKVKLNGLWGALDTSGNYILTADYSEITLKPNNTYYGPGLIYLQKPGVEKPGLCNYKGEMINPFYYEKVKDFIPETYGRVDTDFLPFFCMINYANIFQCFPGNDQREYEVLSSHGKVILDSAAIKRSYTEGIRYYLFRDSVIGIYDNKDSTGKGQFAALPFKGECVGYFNDHPGRTIENNEWFFSVNTPYGKQIVDGNGKHIINEKFDDVKSFNRYINSNGDSLSVFVVKRGSKYGLIDFNGKLLVDYTFDQVTVSYESIEALSDNKNYRLNEQFEPVLQPHRFRAVNKFRNMANYTMTTNNEKIGLSLTDGTEIIPAKWTEIEPRFTDADGTVYFLCTSPLHVKRFHEEVAEKFTLYEQNGNELVRRSNVYVGLLTNGYFYLESKRKVEIFNNKGLMITKTRKPLKRRKEEIRYVLAQPVYEVVNGELTRNAMDLQLTFLTKKGWVVLDADGNTIFTSNVKTGSCARIISDYKQQLIGMEIQNRNGNPETIITRGGVRNFENGSRYFYSGADGRIHETDPDSLRIMDVNFNVIKSLKLQPFGMAQSCNYFSLNDSRASQYLDSVYVLYDETYTFTDFNFVPFNHPPVTGYKVTHYNLIGKNQGKEFLMLKNGKWVENPGKYDRIEENLLEPKQPYICYNGNQFDLYSVNGALIFENCTNLKKYNGFYSFSCNGKTIWMTNSGKTYEPKEN